MRDKFTQYRTVTMDDTDGLGHVNNVRYVLWIQEISERHWEEWAPRDVRESVAWVVYNHNITYYAAAMPEDEIRLTTYIKKTEKVFSYRVVQMHRVKDDTLLVEATTTWCMVDINTHRPKRIDPKIARIFGGSE